MKSRNRIGLIVASVALVAVMAGFAFQSFKSFTFGSSSTKPYRDLTRVSLLEAIGKGDPDHFVYLDSNAGWFLLPDPDRLGQVQIGMREGRLFDAVSGGHLPVYCGGTRNEGRHIWAIKGEAIVQQIAFCNSRRMDLTELAPFGTPVTHVSDRLPKAEAQALAAKVRDQSDYVAVKLPQSFDQFDMRKEIRLPYIWTDRSGSNPYQQDWEASITAIIERDLPQIADTYAFDFNLGYATDYGPPITDADGNPTLGPQASGVRIDGQGYVFTPGFAIYGPVATFRCDPDVCAVLDTLDLSELTQPFRDFDELDTAQEQRRALSVVNDNMPDIGDIRADRPPKARAEPILYDLQYVITGRDERETPGQTGD